MRMKESLHPSSQRPPGSGVFRWNMSFDIFCTNKLVNLTILLIQIKENEFRKIVSGHRKLTENFASHGKELGESIMPSDVQLQLCCSL